jgi:endogenous inhibitor of DNA gyrase (YacG/DUF329 family)
MKRVPRIAITCANCGKVFYERASRHRKLCSKACEGMAAASKYAAKRIKKTCEACGKEYYVRPGLADSRFCSMKCGNPAKSKETALKRGRIFAARGAKPTTYRKLNGRHAHRIIAEQSLGRPIAAGEIVHHRDENKHNNAPDNLEVLPSQAVHARIHATKNRICIVPGCGRKHAALGYCEKHWRRFRKGTLGNYDD